LNCKKSPVCPVDKSELTIDRANSSMQCPESNRVYYAHLDYDNKQQEEMNEYDDIETVSSTNYGSGAGPILLSSAHDKDDFRLKSESKEDDKYENMLRKSFGSHVTITTEVDVPS
jgi:hypothetical protein